MIPKSDGEWSEIKDLVVKHHINEDKPLKEVVQMIQDQLSFNVKYAASTFRSSNVLFRCAYGMSSGIE